MKYRYSSLIDQEVDGLADGISGDTAIVSASWETRSQAMLSVLKVVKVKKLIVIRFVNHGKTGISGGIRNAYKKFCRENSIIYREFSFNSTSKDYAELTVASRAVDEMIAGDLRLIIDITSTPRLLWSSLVALWDKKNSVRNIAFVYARPRYSFKESPKKEPIYDYTQGEWSLCDPAYMPNVYKSGLFKSNIISIGYEYDNIKRLLYRFESDNNIFVYANPGFRPSYTNLAINTVKKIKSVFEIPDSKFLPFGVNDFMGILNSINRQLESLRSKAGSSTMLVCAGSKLHSLAFLFCALENEDVSFKVRVPVKYNEVSTGWAEKIEAINVENVFCPI